MQTLVGPLLSLREMRFWQSVDSFHAALRRKFSQIKGHGKI